MTHTIPIFSDSYTIGMEHIFEQAILTKYPNAHIQFVEQTRGMTLEITVGDKKIYDRLTPFVSKRRCIENFFDEMVKKSL